MNTARITVVAVSVWASILTGCSEKQATPRPEAGRDVPAASNSVAADTNTKAITSTEYRVLATVKAVNESDSTITIDHEEMEGFMKAMTMPYKVQDLALLKRVRVGTSGHFTLRVDHGKGVITSVHIHHR